MDISPKQKQLYAEHFRKLADNMQGAIDQKARQPDWKPTRRRLEMDKSRMADHAYLTKLQSILRGMSAGWETGDLHPILRRLRHKNEVAALMRLEHWKFYVHSEDRCTSISENDFADARAALLSLVPDQPTDNKVETRLKEREIALEKIPGYFPTPTDIVQRMLAKCTFQDGMRVLEPSAGAGHIADGILLENKNVHLNVCEINPRLLKILELKGFNIVSQDFMQYQTPAELCYDYILMNPPFEKNQDVEHVMRAAMMLKPCGRLVAIMSEHPFFASDSASVEFRKFLENYGESEQLPDGSFEKSDRSTGVNTRLVIIDRPPDGKFKVPAADKPKKISDIKITFDPEDMEKINAAAEKVRAAMGSTGDLAEALKRMVLDDIFKSMSTGYRRKTEYDANKTVKLPEPSGGSAAKDTGILKALKDGFEKSIGIDDNDSAKLPTKPGTYVRDPKTGEWVLKK